MVTKSKPPAQPRKSLRFGARPTPFTARHFAAAARLAECFESLGPPPANSINWTDPVVQAVGGDWGMMGNDEAGDCMIAECGHAIMQTSANDAGPTGMVQPDTAACLAFYEAESGWNGIPDDPTDAGTDEGTLTAFLAKNPFDGVNLLAHAPIHINNLNHVKWAVQKLCGARYCIYLPQSAMDQFDRGEPWDVVPLNQDGGIVGGHAIFGTHYRGDTFYAVTWGKLIPVTAAFLHRYMFEAHAEIWSSFLGADGQTLAGENITALIADLKRINAGP